MLAHLGVATFDPPPARERSYAVIASPAMATRECCDLSREFAIVRGCRAEVARSIARYVVVDGPPHMRKGSSIQKSHDIMLHCDEEGDRQISRRSRRMFASVDAHRRPLTVAPGRLDPVARSQCPVGADRNAQQMFPDVTRAATTGSRLCLRSRRQAAVCWMRTRTMAMRMISPNSDELHRVPDGPGAPGGLS